MNANVLTSGGNDFKSTDLHTSNKIDKQEKQLQHNDIGSVTIGKGGGKHSGDKKPSVNFDEKAKIELDLEVTELLGSVTTHNCPGTRTSARVIQKMKQDQTRPITPPPSEREHNKKEEKNVQKTPSQVRANKPTWTNLERNHFFDALNEFGKDFESIGNYINSKLKRKCSTDVSFKTKDQVRQHYFQTYHKICKYIKFSDEVKKPAQELYALINYGEMRRKLQFVTDKHFMKLRNLVYQGHIIVRCKGKNIRIKTPSCKALRRLNQLDDSLEDIRLPSKIEVIVSPANLEAFGRVQVIAQNPRARTTVPLHKKLVNFIKTFQYKWRSSDMKLAEEEAKLFPLSHSTATEANLTQLTSDTTNNTATNEKHPASLSPAYQDAEMCFLPKPNVTIHRPLLSITEYLSSVNICLTAYEERMGVKVRGETLSQERPLSKRQRTESGSEKRSPDTKKQKQSNHNSCQEIKLDPELNSSDNLTATSANTSMVLIKEESAASQESESIIEKSEASADELNDEINELLSDTDNLLKEELFTTTITTTTSTSTVSKTTATTESSKIETPIVVSASTTVCSTTTTTATLTSVQNPSRAKRGSGGSGNSANTRSSRPSLTFKPLISDDVIKRIRKGWTVSSAADITIGDLYVVLGQDSKLELEYYWTDFHSTTSTKISNTDAIATSASSLPDPISTSIFAQRQNGMPYNPSECNDPNLLNALSSSTVANKLKHLLLIANLSERIRKRQCSCGHTCERIVAKTRIERDLAAKTFVSNKTFSSNSGTDGSGLFRQPMPIRRPIFNMDPVKQLSTLTRQKLSRQVLVQRLLLPGRANHSYDLLDVKNLQNNITLTHNDLQHNESQNTKVLNTNTVAAQDTSADCIATAAAADPPALAASNATLINACNVPLPSDNYSNFTETRATSASAFTLPKIQYFGSSSPPYNNIQSQLNNAADEATSEASEGLSLPSSSSLPDSAFDDCSNTSLFNSMSPMHLLRDSTSNSRWLEENLNDFSLTSLLGHLDEINSSRDILDPSSNLSVISESSVDYMHKFQEITALMQSQDKD